MSKKHCANCKCYETCPTCGSEVPADRIVKPPVVIYPYSYPYIYPWWTYTTSPITITSGSGSTSYDTNSSTAALRAVNS